LALKILLLNQCFYPDVAATGQYLTDVAVELAKRGHSVTVITSDSGYDDPAERFPSHQYWQGIEIIRISSFRFGKKTRLGRALNFGSFLIVCALRLLFLARFDAVIALTSPPLISFLGSLFVQLRGGKFFFWVMDLNPDEAIAAGWLNKSSLTAGVLEWFLRYSLGHAERVIVLDRFMKRRVLDKGIGEPRIVVLPPWAHDDVVSYDRTGREEFRRQHDFSEKFVVMYSGNQSPCHPLDTLLEAAFHLEDRKEIVFCFVGGGSEQAKIRDFSARYNLQNVLCLLYQPLNELSNSLSAADLHVVVMGERFVGIVHPCKVYNILTVGCPFLYIGPEESHIADIARNGRNSNIVYMVRHGDVLSAVKSISFAAARWSEGRNEPTSDRSLTFSKQSLLPRMIEVIEAGVVSEEEVGSYEAGVRSQESGA
jgi:glycosyltransferase involved in cell wall biosynthesis